MLHTVRFHLDNIFLCENTLDEEDRFSGCQEFRMGMGGARGRKVGVVIKRSIVSICRYGVVSYLDSSGVYRKLYSDKTV